MSKETTVGALIDLRYIYIYIYTQILEILYIISKLVFKKYLT